jgi:hypothetical protein
MDYRLRPEETQAVPDIPLAEIGAIYALPVVPQVILPQAITAPAVVQIAQDNAIAQPANETSNCR